MSQSHGSRSTGDVLVCEFGGLVLGSDEDSAGATRYSSTA